MAKQEPPTTSVSSRTTKQQGWVQWTDRGKMYLSRHEKNVFVLEGTTSSGFAACKYTGSPEEEELMSVRGPSSQVVDQQGRSVGPCYSVLVELKSNPSCTTTSAGVTTSTSSASSTSSLPGSGGGNAASGDEIFVLLDALDASDLSSGCDFCAVKLGFQSREIRVENRRKTHTQTLFVLPNVLMLRTNTYLTLRVDIAGDRICALVLNGVTLVQNLTMGRNLIANTTGALGVATYGRSRVFLKRFKVEKFQPTAASFISSTCAAPEMNNNTVVQLSTTPKNANYAGASSHNTTPSLQVVPAPMQGTAARGTNMMAAAPSTSVAAQYGVFPSSPDNKPLGMGPAGTNGGAAHQGPLNILQEELDLHQTIERDLLLNPNTSQNLLNFDDIGGLEMAKTAINEAVVLPLLVPEFFTGIRKPCRGVLLYGPPGTGKTMLAKAIASTATESVAFFNCSCATLTSKWRGESEKLLRALFNMARARHPSILFFDEVDSLLSARGSHAEHEASRRFKSEFLIHMDGLLADGRDENRTPLVLCTSNAPWDLDDALKRRCLLTYNS
ncbi:unnamed protein product [Amoebophrya sp. A120]|nr:unnamed protein product [Amoebophrya sp. A120]|eukprot:GSA120T00023136001.1